MKPIKEKMRPMFMAANDMTSGYFPNWMNKYEIGPLPIGEAKPELHELAEGITTVETESEEEEEDYAYYSHRGSTEKEITSVNSSYSFEGHRKYKDNPAQQLVRDALDKTGDGRKVYFRHVEPDGRVREGKATLSGIVHTGGDANVRGTLEFTVTFDGTPKDTKGNVPEG